MKKKLIYICSPCRGNDGNYEHNIEMAQYYCRTVMHMFPNLLPIAPHVYFTQFLDDSDPCERRMGMIAGMELLEQCSEVWVFGMENPSAGMKKEIAKANELDIPIVDAAEALTIHCRQCCHICFRKCGGTTTENARATSGRKCQRGAVS